MADSPNIQCPRCGYDLSGAYSAAQAAQSVDGSCSECGLRFSWAEVISGRLHTPRFSYEHGSVLSITRFARTFARSLTGGRLWGHLKMVHDIRAGRLAIFAFLSLLVMHLAAGVVVMLGVRFGFVGNWSPNSAVAWNAARLRSLNGPTPTSPPSVLTTSPVVFSLPGRWPVTVGDLASLVLWPYGHSPAFFRPAGTIGVNLDLEPILAAGSTLFGPALVLLLLRQTRRRFRVRTMHVWRAVCLAAPVIIGTLLLTQMLMITVAWPAFLQIGILRSAGVPVGVGLVCYVGYHTLWWWAFTRRYLHAPHALGIAAAGVVIGALCFVLAAVAVHSDLLYGLLA